jgi:hypothetical protein
MTATAPTWDCGTIRSTGNAFTWATPKPVKKLTEKQEAIAHRNAGQKARRDKAKAIADATRVNREASLAAFIPSSLKAPR